MKINLQKKIPYCSEIFHHWQTAKDKLDKLAIGVEYTSEISSEYAHMLEVKKLVDDLERLSKGVFYNKESGLPLTIETGETIGICGTLPEVARELESIPDLNKRLEVMEYEMKKNINFGNLYKFISGSGSYKNMLFFNSNDFDSWVNSHLIFYLHTRLPDYKYYVLQPYYEFPIELNSLYEEKGVFSHLDRNSFVFIATGSDDIYGKQTRKLLPEFCDFVMEYRQNHFVDIIRLDSRN